MRKLTALMAQVICLSGSFVSSPLCKNISVFIHPKSSLELFASRPHKGRIAIVTDAARDAVDAAAFCARWIAGQVSACEQSPSVRTRDVVAYGEVVWS